jgi:hypothetical protein
MINWEPREFLRQARQQELSVFIAATEKCGFMLVSLETLDSELAAGLRALDGSRIDTDALAFRTAVVRAPQTTEKPSSADETMAGRQGVAAMRGKPVADKIPDSFLGALCHVVPIRNRSAESFVQRVSIGRARNNDIVLRHSSVSKFHAWIEIRDDKRLVVRDSESRNHTYLDGQQVVGRVEVSPGQTIRFGSVEAQGCSGESLWYALQG